MEKLIHVLVRRRGSNAQVELWVAPNTRISALAFAAHVLLSWRSTAPKGERPADDEPAVPALSIASSGVTETVVDGDVTIGRVAETYDLAGGFDLVRVTA